MVGRLNKKTVLLIVPLILIMQVFLSMELPISANVESGKGIQYQFDADCKYEEDNSKSQSDITGKSQYGEFKLDGDIKSVSDKNGFHAYEVSSGTVALKYSVDVDKSLEVVDDKVKQIDDITLETNVLSGAVVVQTSMDGEKWLVDKVYTNILSGDGKFDSMIYESNYVQQANGCYFRVIVAYKTQKLVKTSKVLFVDTSDYEQTRWKEVYEFYISDKEKGNVDSVNIEPKRIFQDSKYRIQTKKNKGYATEEKSGKDPHYGWNLGDFTVNGYTAVEDTNNDEPIFLKNVGDQVTLWFTLKQDINKLDGKDNLYINEDKKGWDDSFATPKGNFRKGALVIQQTDVDGADGEPVIFTNYLEANVRTGADTKVKLFEEGDYAVALDYEIKDTSSIIDDVYDYRVFFKFKIRNSNCNIFLFDTGTQSELLDRANTENGFRLDYANSKYLKVYVEHKTINFNGTSYSADTRGNKVGKNGSEYTDEGIYTISVWREYNDSSSTDKTIFVGNSPIIKALSRNNISIEDINNLIAQGYKIDNEGALVSNTIEKPEAEDNEEASEETSKEVAETVNDDTIEETSAPIVKKETPDASKTVLIPIATVGIVVLAGIGFFWVKGLKKKASVTEKSNHEE